ncbi:MAG: hypothetical protein LUH14_00560 [Clostridiaceae bacterium]|nr:hypothetical protein [Clostridiaceae bacterium]
MGCLYLHVGTPKTGTTTIQYFLAQNRDTLNKKGYSFPDMKYHFDTIGKYRNAHFLFHHIYNEQNERQYEEENALRKEGMETLLKQFHETENIILSDEALWNGAYTVPDFWKELYTTLSAAGHTLKVIVYLRRQDSYIQSYWAQSVKCKSMNLDFAGYLATKPWKRVHANYIKTLDYIASYIGQENIIVRPFEWQQFCSGPEGHSLTADFLHYIGLELTEEYASADNVKNGTISGEYIQIKQILNSNPAFSDKKGFMVSLLRNATMNQEEKASYQRASCFPSGDPSAFLEKFEAGNAEIAKRYLNRRDGVLFYEKPKKNSTMEPYTKEELVNACGDIILELKQQLDENEAASGSIKKQSKILARLLRNRLKKIPKQIKSKFSHNAVFSA